MNLSIKEIKQSFSSTLRGGRRYGDHGMLHPERQWHLILVVAVLVVVVGAGWATRVYWHYDQMVKDPSFLQVTTEPTYRAALIEKALTVLSERKTQYEQLERKLRGYTSLQIGAPEDVSKSQSVSTSTATSTATTTTTIIGTTTPDINELPEVEDVAGEPRAEVKDETMIEFDPNAVEPSI